MEGLLTDLCAVEGIPELALKRTGALIEIILTRAYPNDFSHGF